MSQNKRESITSFVDERLKIHINTSWVLENDNIYHMPFDDYYQIYYLRTGNFICYQDNKRLSVDEGSIIIKPFNKELIFKSNVKSNGKYIKTEIIIISIHPSLFKEQKGDDKMLTYARYCSRTSRVKKHKRDTRSSLEQRVQGAAVYTLHREYRNTHPLRKYYK